MAFRNFIFAGSERSFHVTVEPQKKFNWTHQQVNRFSRAYPSSEFAVGISLAKWKKLEPKPRF